MLDDARRRALSKVRKCLDLAADTRGDPTTRETAWRQAQALIDKHGLHQLLTGQHSPPAPAPAAAPAVPAHGSAEWAPYWAQRTAEEALAAGVRAPVRCADGWAVPG